MQHKPLMFPAMVLLLMLKLDAVALALLMAPATLAPLPAIVLLFITVMPVFSIPPPMLVQPWLQKGGMALLLETVLALTVNLPLFQTPPPTDPQLMMIEHVL
jgi:hypothetical protein